MMRFLVTKLKALHHFLDVHCYPHDRNVARWFKSIRRLWCYTLTTTEDASYFTPDARWNGDGHEIDITYVIPFWIRNEDDVEDYIDQHIERDWLYCD